MNIVNAHMYGQAAEMLCRHVEGGMWRFYGGGLEEVATGRSLTWSEVGARIEDDLAELQDLEESMLEQAAEERAAEEEAAWGKGGGTA